MRGNLPASALHQSNGSSSLRVATKGDEPQAGRDVIGTGLALNRQLASSTCASSRLCGEPGRPCPREHRSQNPRLHSGAHHPSDAQFARGAADSQQRAGLRLAPRRPLTAGRRATGKGGCREALGALRKPLLLHRPPRGRGGGASPPIFISIKNCDDA